MKPKNTQTLNEIKEKHFGKRGTKKREELEAGYEMFKAGVLIQQTRQQLGMTQEELAIKVGTTTFKQRSSHPLLPSLTQARKIFRPD